MSTASFAEIFRQATGWLPYAYQVRLAECERFGEKFPELLDVPTGLGKTAAVVLAWLWRRRYAHHIDDPTAREKLKAGTPRRLVYCLPMRTLVEQTETATRNWLQNLGLHEDIMVHVLRGGTEDSDWDHRPEREAILIGTQDMLLSRALNRGYAMSRYRWPVHFALLNNDCLWVLDETQLMGVGVTTSAQLQGLRKKLGHYSSAHTLWMSATLDRSVLSTVDYPVPDDGLATLTLGADDLREASVRRLIDAEKPCSRAAVTLSPQTDARGYAENLAQAVVDAHLSGELTLVILNRVQRCQCVWRAMSELLSKQSSEQPQLFLIHSRFRNVDRDRHQTAALDEKTIPQAGRIVIATQAIEAGVDISATTLFTELAPWSSMVQRFGRCNRRGLCGNEGRPAAHVHWVDIDTSDEKKAPHLTRPYVPRDLDTARGHLAGLSDVGRASLAKVEHEEPRRFVHTLRRKDLLELWDTTPDLCGNDLDVSRYIRETDDIDVQVFWRDGWDESKRESPPDDVDTFPAPDRRELCQVPLYALAGNEGFLATIRKRFSGWSWNPLDKRWDQVSPDAVRPGMVLLLHSQAGGYDADVGWTGNPNDQPVEPHPPIAGSRLDAMDQDNFGEEPVPLTDHLREVAQAAEKLRESVGPTSQGVDWDAVVRAAWWHDVGKAHPAFQQAMRDSPKVLKRDPEGKTLWAKSGEKRMPHYRDVETDADGIGRQISRRGFRHELASALAWLRHQAGEADTDLTAFLIAAHHGKVRGSIRSLPNETKPRNPEVRFARGVWDGDVLPAIELGNGQTTGQLTLSLELMELGDSETDGPSWLARVLELRERFGPFRLSFLEALVRIADWLASNQGDG